MVSLSGALEEAGGSQAGKSGEEEKPRNPTNTVLWAERKEGASSDQKEERGGRAGSHGARLVFKFLSNLPNLRVHLGVLSVSPMPWSLIKLDLNFFAKLK